MVGQFILLLVGLALVVLGADYLVDGASSLARKAGLSEFVIGLTIVGIGTSTPEMVVSFMGAFQGNADISVGNVIGSNIFNVLLILGLTAVIRPMNMTRSNVHTDIPVNILVTVLLVLLGLNHTIFNIGDSDVLSRVDGVVFLMLFIAYLIYSFKEGRKEGQTSSETQDDTKIWLAAVMIIGGLFGLIFGGNLFVNAAENIAKHYGMSDKFIAITILAGGTSMPELVTCVVAALKKKGQLALGNILGSNVSNILLILGGSAMICPLSFANITYVDLGVLMLSGLLVWSSAYTGKHRWRLNRADGVIMLACEVAYMTYLISNL